MIPFELFLFTTNVLRKGYKPHMSSWYTVLAGILTFLLVFFVLFVRYRISKEMKRRGLNEKVFRRRKKTNRR